jgi:beta-lactamase regulating signal transducer with metallopeptidase domain/uncharacterized membrane protein YkoI
MAMKTSSQFLLTFLLNAIWQIPIVVGLACLGAHLIRNLSSRYSHLLWVSVLVLSFALPGVTSARVFNKARLPEVSPVVLERTPFPQTPKAAETRFNSAPTLSRISSFELDRRIAFALLAAYFAFLLWRVFKLIQAWRLTRSIRRSASSVDLSPQLHDVVRSCEAAVQVNSPVGILSSNSIPVPVAIGVFRPVIVLPEELLVEGNIELLKSAVGHELVHVARRDYLWNFLCELISLPILFNPATTLVRRRIKQTRELCCDEFVADRVLNAEVYARSLVKLASSAPALRRLSVTTTVGIADADILEARIMSLLRKPKLNTRWKSVLLITVSLMLVVPCVAAAAIGMRYEVATRDEVAQDPAKEREMREVVKMREQGGEQEVKLRVSEELMTKRRMEMEMMAVKQNALISLARISMEQAIQIATSQTPGKVINCALDVDRWEEPGKIAKDGKIFYRVIVVTGEENNTVSHHIWVNAIDGTIIKTEKELPRKIREVRVP